MKKIFLFTSLIILLACNGKAVVYEGVITPHAAVVNLDGARFVMADSTVLDTQYIRISKSPTRTIDYPGGYRKINGMFRVGVTAKNFNKPLSFYYPANNKNVKLAVQYGRGLVPLADSRVVGETLQATIRHPGNYYIIQMPETYGIAGASKTDQALLIVSDLYVSHYLNEFKKVLKEQGYNHQVWTYYYSGDVSIVENARRLAQELKNLHERFGEFRLDVLSFGVGGLITHRYLVDSALYGYDISSAIVSVGTPFFGSNFADYDTALKYFHNPYRFFFIDAMGKNAADIDPKSEFTRWVTGNRSIAGWLRDDLDENKNFASLSGRKHETGMLPEKSDGDALISWESTQLTWIEPEPFPLNHFELYENEAVFETAVKFINLYRTFNWPRLFSSVWEGSVSMEKVNETWEREIKLTMRKPIEYDIILEWNENLLKSAPQDAVLITNGDLDTYPGWLLQGKGIRPDVLIVNRSLLNLKGYIRFLQKKGLPIYLRTEQIDSLNHRYDKKTDRVYTISDQIIGLLAQQKTRPLVLSTTVYDPQAFGFPLVLNGLVYLVGAGGVDIGTKWFKVDIEKNSELLLDKFSYKKITSIPIDSLNQSLSGLFMNYGSSLYSLGKALVKEKRYAEAMRILSFATQHINQPKSSMGPLYLLQAEVYFEIGDKQKAISVVGEFVDSPFPKSNREDSLNLINVYKDAASLYIKMGEKDQAIKLLAECLKITPDDKELLKLIQKYQEE